MEIVTIYGSFWFIRPDRFYPLPPMPSRLNHQIVLPNYGFLQKPVWSLLNAIPGMKKDDRNQLSRSMRESSGLISFYNL
jgi:hypothetical protein